MGVPYKLDIKIVEFVISQKQANPELGCRSFVVLIRDKFGFDISKSTVNAVIKEAGLSKRVGRPRLTSKRTIKEDKKPVSFKESPLRTAQPFILPFQKKEELKPAAKIEAPKEALPEAEEKPIILPERKIEPEQKPELPAEIKAEKPQEIAKPELLKPEIKPLAEVLKPEKPKEPPQEEKPQKPLPQIKMVEPTKVREIKKEIPLIDMGKLIQPNPIKEDEVLDSLGVFFLKAAELEISRNSILGDLVRGLSSSFDPVDTEIKSNILLYLSAFGIKDIASLDTYSQEGLWAFSNVKQKVNSSALLGFLKELQQREELFSKLYYYSDSNFKEVLYFKFLLSDGTILLLDGRLKSIWQGPNIPDNLTVSQNKAKSFIENKFVQIFTKETQPVILFNVPSFRSFSPLVSEFVSAFEDIPDKRIIGIDIISSNNQELESYNHIVPARRWFVFGFWPWQEEAKGFIKSDIGVVREFYFPELARQIYYTENQVEFPKQSQNKLHLIFLKNSAFSSPRMGLLSNINSQVMDTQQLIRLYLLRWPNFEDTYQDLLESSERLTYRGFVYPVFDEDTRPKREQTYILPSSEFSASDNINILLFNLSISCQRHFFPYGYRFADFATMKERFYGLPGRLRRKDQNLYITLIVPKDYAYSNDLFYAVRRINESDITDTFGHKIWFKVV